MVGGVKPRAFKYNTYRRINFAQCFFVAFWTARQRWITEVLVLIELDATIITVIRVRRHKKPELSSNNTVTTKRDYSALLDHLQGKPGLLFNYERAASGKVKVKQLPPPGFWSTQILPPFASTARRQKVNPRPEPRCLP